MATASPQEIANTLKREQGADAGIRYCERIERNGYGPIREQYKAARLILEEHEE